MRDKFEFEQYVYARSEELSRQEKARRLLIRKRVVSAAAVICVFSGIFTAVRLTNFGNPDADLETNAMIESYESDIDVIANGFNGNGAFYDNNAVVLSQKDQTQSEGKENSGNTDTDTPKNRKEDGSANSCVSEKPQAEEDFSANDGAVEAQSSVPNSSPSTDSADSEVNTESIFFDSIFYYAPHSFYPSEENGQVPVCIILNEGNECVEGEAESSGSVTDYESRVEICRALLTVAKCGFSDYSGDCTSYLTYSFTVITGGSTDMTIDVYSNMVVVDNRREYPITDELMAVIDKYFI